MGKPKGMVVEEVALGAASELDAGMAKALAEYGDAVKDCHECAALAVQLLSRSLARHLTYDLKLDLGASGHEGLMKFVATELKEAAEFFECYSGQFELIRASTAHLSQPQN